MSTDDVIKGMQMFFETLTVGKAPTIFFCITAKVSDYIIHCTSMRRVSSKAKV
jgi:hypothetical protein